MKYQVIIIGGGPAGYTAAEAAGKGGLSVLLIEKNSLGGVCLNEGCIPTKTLLYSAKTYDSAKHASKYAVNIPEVSFDLPKIIRKMYATNYISQQKPKDMSDFCWSVYYRNQQRHIHAI